MRITSAELAAELSGVTMRAALTLVDEAYTILADAAKSIGDVNTQIVLLRAAKAAVDTVVSSQTGAASAGRAFVSSLGAARLAWAKAVLEQSILERTAEILRTDAAAEEPSLARALTEGPLRALRPFVEQRLSSGAGGGPALRQLKRVLDEVESVANQRVPLLKANIANCHAELGRKVRERTANALVLQFETQAMELAAAPSEQSMAAVSALGEVAGLIDGAAHVAPKPTVSGAKKSSLGGLNADPDAESPVRPSDRWDRGSRSVAAVSASHQRVVSPRGGSSPRKGPELMTQTPSVSPRHLDPFAFETSKSDLDDNANKQTNVDRLDPFSFDQPDGHSPKPSRTRAPTTTKVSHVACCDVIYCDVTASIVHAFLVHFTLY